MSFKGFLFTLLTFSIIGILLHMAIYETKVSDTTKFLLIGTIVAQNIITIKWSIIGYKMLLRAHKIVETWLIVLSRKIFGNYAYEGRVLNRGSTNYMLNTSSGLPFVEELSSKVRIFHDKSKYYFKDLQKDLTILNKRGCVQPNVAALSTLIDVSQQQNWLQEIPTDELLMWLWQIGVSNANDIHLKQQPFVRFALNELKRRANMGQYQPQDRDVSPLFEGRGGFECPNVIKPVVRYAS